ncbi:MAG: hypothetical protein NVSMB70_01060 [Chamaesiphon sp.]
MSTPDQLYSTVAFGSDGYLYGNQPIERYPADKLPGENRRMYRERTQKQRRMKNGRASGSR